MPARDEGRRLDAGALVQLGQALKAAGYRFTTITPGTHARVVARDPGAAASSLRDVFGWSRPYARAAGAQATAAATAAPAAVPEHMAEMMERSGIALPAPDGEADTARLRSTLRCSTLDDQLYFHSAYPTSDTGAVFFGPDTYRYVRALRSETAMRDGDGVPPPARIADLCCGAGPAAIALAGRYPQAEVLAIDINRDALELTQVNAELAGARNVHAVISDLLGAVEGGFDLITANPPYLLDAAQRSYRHGGGQLGEGLALRIVETALQRLNPGGALMLYTGVAVVDGQDVLLRRAAPLLDAAACTWRYEEIDPDVFGEELALPAYAGAERIAAVWLTVIQHARQL